jgi:mersacidin/lichenicidin family type 2 lantibiotic
MSHNSIVRAWKDPVYRNSLSESERAALPPNPAGAIEISDLDLGKVAGGTSLVSQFCTMAQPASGCCSWFNCSSLSCATASCPIQK